ncbi:ADL147Wp [Eremothecium gossypii ATCC 10895]|uniref:ADL147Wp n=1 Tax=Eremothecium gossypii (strain ATCC 10895 / CBS 109.51 / FGSC 9923 / NRRL Y-1056) TaxID=284811 RepID=Q75AR7_EREGS|nr:ADL147Wp [Eremothecium gossypii ATCC 10895]AAS51773.2 ADL147Wp [Eremothecium gossypii ATCC 10895]AEY96070.1 FADL147Wp [Eremothecium gossypii FDAG1]
MLLRRSMLISNTPAISGYKSNVSFQDLTPALVDEQVTKIRKLRGTPSLSSALVHIPPHLNPLYVDTSVDDDEDGEEREYGKGIRRPSLNMDLGYSAQSQQEVTEAYKFIFDGTAGSAVSRRSTHLSPPGSRSASPQNSKSGPPGLRLPPPPRLSILKNKDVAQDAQDFDTSKIDIQQELVIEQLTKQNTESNSPATRGYSTGAFARLQELEDRLMSDGQGGSSRGQENKSARKARRKSYADMSDSELAQLEDSMNPYSATSNIDKFDFSEQSKLYIGPTNPSKNLPRIKTDNPPTSIYPSRPAVPYHAISCSNMHEEYSAYVSQTAAAANGAKPRTVACYLSGRRHSWSAVDAYINMFARSGDHLVIWAYLPMYDREITNLSSKTSERPKSSLDMYQFATEKKTTKPETASDHERACMMVLELDNIAKAKCKSLLDFYTKRCSHLIMKVTVEFIKHESMQGATANLISLYEPDMEFVSTISTTFNVKFRNGHVKLPTYLAKHASIPTVIVSHEFVDTKRAVQTPSGEVTQEPGIQLKRLENIVLSTSVNPYDVQSLNSRGTDLADCSSDEGDDEGSEASASVGAYFPSDQDMRRKRDQFNTLGYIPPKPVYVDTRQLLSIGSSRSSRRSSRHTFTSSEIYQVKSMISDDIPYSTNPIRTVKSAQSASSGTTNSTPLPRPVRRIEPMTPSTPASSNPPTKKKGKLFSKFKQKIGLK